MRDLLQEDRSARKVLRPHQEEAIRLVRSSLGSGLRRVVCQGPTGFGKSLCAAKIIEMARAKGNRVIFTAPAISLIDQTVAAFEAEGIDGIGVLQASHPRTNPAAPVQVASVQTMAKRDIPAAALVIIDECHIRAEVVDRLMDDRPDVFFIGLTATPWAKGMGLRWQGLVIPTTIGALIDGGYLSQFTVFAPDVPDLRGVKVRMGEYAENGLAKVMGDAKLIGSVVETWLAKGGDRPTLCFAVNRAHAAELQAGFMARGIAAAYVDANTDIIHRARIGRQFKSGEVRVICSVRTMTTGVDLPVSCIIDAAPTKSEILHVQKIGRGLRVNQGTEDLLVLDHAGNSLRLGLVTDIHHDTLDATQPGDKAEPKAGAEKLPKPCTACGALHTGAVCPACGHVRKPGSGVKAGDGELVELTPGKAPNPAAMREWKAGLKQIQLERGRSDGWFLHAYRKKFGVWPISKHCLPGPATQEMRNWVKAQDIAYAKARGK